MDEKAVFQRQSPGVIDAGIAKAYVAASNGHKHVAELLLAKGAEADA